MRALSLFALCFWLALGASSASAAWDSGLSIPPAAPVVDEAGVLGSGEAQKLTQLLRELKARSGVEVSVYIASSLQDRAIEDFSMAVAEKWQLGRKKEDRGLLFLIAPNERKMRFEVGYGLEGEITDAYSRRVLDNVVRPYFKTGDYYEGILAGLAAVSEKVPLGLKAGEAPDISTRRAPPSLLIWALIILVMLFSFFARIFGFVSPYSRRSRYYGGWGGGGWGGGGGFGSGGGSWGGGGGGFSGGGSSSSW